MSSNIALAFGVVFDWPLAITLGTRLGLVTPEVHSRNRKYAILNHVIIAAVLTPIPDAFNQVLVAGPLDGRCELVMLGAWIFR